MVTIRRSGIRDCLFWATRATELRNHGVPYRVVPRLGRLEPGDDAATPAATVGAEFLRHKGAVPTSPTTISHWTSTT